MPSKKGKLSVKQNLNMGEVIEVEDSTEGTIDISDFEYVKDFNLEDYLPSVKRPINDIMSDIEEITKAFADFGAFACHCFEQYNGTLIRFDRMI